MGASVVDGVRVVRVFLGGLQQVCSLEKTEREMRGGGEVAEG